MNRARARRFLIVVIVFSFLASWYLVLATVAENYVFFERFFFYIGVPALGLGILVLVLCVIARYVWTGR